MRNSKCTREGKGRCLLPIIARRKKRRREPIASLPTVPKGGRIESSESHPIKEKKKKARPDLKQKEKEKAVAPPS